MKWYELKGTGFAMLSSEERDQILREFSSMLSTLGRGVLLVSTGEEDYSYAGYSFRVRNTRFFLATDSRVSFFGANEVPEEAIKRLRPGVLEEKPDHLILEGGQLARMVSAYGFPSYLPEGFLYSIFPLAREIIFMWKLIPRSRALGMISRARLRKVSQAARGSMEHSREAEELEEMGARVASGEELAEFYIFFTVVGGSRGELDEATRALRDMLKSYLIESDVPLFIQKPLYMLSPCRAGFLPLANCLTKRIADTRSLQAIYMLIDEEMRDPEGIFLGVSGSGSPVIFDPYARQNYNIVILGESGSGKSMTAKLIVKRLRERLGSVGTVIIDPESEYVKVDSYLGIQGLRVEEGENLGLDPIKLMQGGALEFSQVADLLTDLYAIPQSLEGLLRKELFTKGYDVNDLEEFVSSLKSEELRKYLEGATSPPDIYVYRGMPPRLSRAIAFGMRGIRSRRLKIMISALVAAYSYKHVLEAEEKSILLVDEAWLFTNTPSVMDLLENIARRGRKKGLIFIYVSQRTEDIASTPQGRSILEQAATTILLRQERTAWKPLKEIYRLTDEELEALVSAEKGEGIMKSGGKRLSIKILPTPEELEIFSTTPTLVERIKGAEGAVNE